MNKIWYRTNVVVPDSFDNFTVSPLLSSFSSGISLNINDQFTIKDERYVKN